MKFSFLTIACMTFFICSMTSLSAHALFVDSKPTGKSGVTQEVMVFYAEPNDGKASFVPEWKGTYFIETIQKEKVTGQPHKELVQIYTTPLVVR